MPLVCSHLSHLLTTPPLSQRQTTEPQTAEELSKLSGKESRLHALAVLCKLAAGARPSVGAIVTIEELHLLEGTVRAAAELNDVKQLLWTSEDSLESAREGENGYLLDEEMYNSLRNYTSVKIDKPVDKLKRAVRSMKSLALRAAKSPTNEVVAESLPEFVESGVTRWSGDIFEIEKLSELGSLVWVCEFLMARSKLIEQMEVPTANLRNWLVALNQAYLKNSYHNSMHGADVCQTLWCLIENQGHVNHTKLALSNKTK